MLNPQEIEAYYEKYASDLNHYIPDGVFEVDLLMLQELGLLGYESTETEESELLNHSFYVIESQEKLTLFNQKYVVWIVPQLIDELPATYTLVAVNEAQKPQLEMAFATKGIYNHSGLILKILEKFLEEIEENEKELLKFKN